MRRERAGGGPGLTPRRRLWRYVAPQRGVIALAVACVLAANLATLAGPAVLRHAVDGLTAGVARPKLLGYGALLLCAALLRSAFFFSQRRLMARAARGLEYDLSVDFYAHLQRLPLQFFERHRTGDLMTRATGDLAAVRMVVGAAVMYSTNSLFATALTLPVMLSISWRLTLVSFSALPLVALATRVMSKKMHDESGRVQERAALVASQAQESFSGVRVVRAFRQEQAEVEGFRRVNRELVRRNEKLVRLTAAYYPTLRFLVATGFLGAFWYGGLLTLRHEISVGQFVQFTLYLGALVMPLHEFGYVVNLFQRGMASMERIHEIMSAEPAETEAARPDGADAARPDDDADAGRVARGHEIKGEIEFRRLTFAYPGAAEPALRDVSLRIREGQTVAFVGGVGAGKSTLLSLVPRLYEPGAGRLLIDGRPVEEIPLDALRAAIGYVPQETFLFSRTVAENIAWGADGASREEVERAALEAGLADDIAELPGGFETPVGERGAALSGGQRQRAAIARALIRSPRILILDDALSSVDTQTEAKILWRLRRARGGRTNLISSHRLSTVKDADLIVLLEDRRVAELGTHDELLAMGGAYARLYARQMLEEELATS
ncbi:MAG TPA: ABC transporter ATP-binding protein [Pyrinomonadaceae bacterium]